MDLTLQTVVFVAAPEPGDVIAITTLVDNHYYMVGNEVVLNLSTISSDGITLSAGDNIQATTFNNALGMKQRREILEGRASGELFLYNEPLNSDYVFVTLNGSRTLVQNVDFTISSNKITVHGITLSSSDRIDVMYFALDTAKNATGFRIFKDMLNRTFYKRISSNNTTTLSVALTTTASTITVADGTVLSEPSNILDDDGSTIKTITPGVIFIDKERIDELSNTHQHLITIEDNVVTGGAGSSVNEYLVEKGYEITITNFGIPDQIISHGSQSELYAEIGLDKKSLEYKINEIYNYISRNKKIVK